MTHTPDASYSDEYSFRKFSSLPFYDRINAHLIDRSGVANYKKIIDLGCGTGGVTKLILDRISGARDTIIYAVDHSASALRAAVEDIGGRKEAVVRFIHSEVQNLTSCVSEEVDAVVYLNSIHYVPDKASLLSQIRERLSPGGILVFNTSFFNGAHLPETQDFYRRWMMRSLRTLRREYGISPSKDSEKTDARMQLTADEYVQLLEEAGFEGVEAHATSVEVPHAGWHHISGFRDWIEGIMPGVPLAKGKSVLQKSLKQVFQEMELETVPRAWLSVKAFRTEKSS